MSEFTMPVDEAFAAADGTVVLVGWVSTGEVRPGDSLDLCTPCKTIPVSVKSLEAFGRVQLAMAGENIAIRVSGVTKDDVLPGSKLTAKGAK